MLQVPMAPKVQLVLTESKELLVPMVVMALQEPLVSAKLALQEPLDP